MKSMMATEGRAIEIVVLFHGFLLLLLRVFPVHCLRVSNTMLNPDTLTR